MPTMRRPGHCFCLLTVLALACDTSGSPAPRRAAVQPPPPVSEPAARPEPGTYNLRGTPMTGRTRRVELNFDIPDSLLTIKLGPLTVQGTMSLHAHSIDELEIYDVSNGVVRHGRLTHVVDKTVSTTSMTIPGSEPNTETEEEFGELHGRTEVIELNGGQWTRKLVGAAPSAELAAELEAPPTDDALYPTAIKVGGSWTVPGSEIRDWMGSDFTVTTGELKSTFVAVETLQAETIAVIEGVGEIGGKVRVEDGTELDFTMTIQMTERRSLERGMEVTVFGKGTIEFSGSFLEDGQPVPLSVTGPLTMRVKGTLL